MNHFSRSDASCADTRPALSGRTRHAPTHSPFYQVENTTRRRTAHFTRSKTPRADAQPILPGRKRHAPMRSPFYLIRPTNHECKLKNFSSQSHRIWKEYLNFANVDNRLINLFIDGEKAESG